MHPTRAVLRVEGEMEPGPSDGRAHVLERARELVAALKAAPAGQRLVLAEQRHRSDPEIQRILEILRERTASYRQAQARGTPPQEQVRALREAQAEYRAHPLVHEVERARVPFEVLLRDVNGAMADILGLDVGRIVGPVSGTEPGSRHGP